MESGDQSLDILNQSFFDYNLFDFQQLQPIETFEFYDIQQIQPLQTSQSLQLMHQIEPLQSMQQQIAPLESIQRVESLDFIQEMQPLPALQYMQSLSPINSMQPMQPLSQMLPVQAVQPMQPLSQMPPVQAVQPMQPLSQMPPVQGVQPMQPLSQMPPVQAVQPMQPFSQMPPVQAVQPMQPLSQMPPVQAVQPMQPLSQMPPVQAVQPRQQRLSFPPVYAVQPMPMTPQAMTPGIPMQPVLQMSNNLSTYPLYDSDSIFAAFASEYIEQEQEEYIPPETVQVEIRAPPTNSAFDVDLLVQPLEYDLDTLAEFDILQPPTPVCIPVAKPMLKRVLQDTDFDSNQNSEKLCYANLAVKKCKFTIPLNRIPTWATYSHDQRFLIPQFTIEDASHSYQYDPYLNRKISLCFDDITCLEVDAIVNSTTACYIPPHGEFSEAHRILGELMKLSWHSMRVCEVGHVEITPGFGLPSKFVIHTNGPYGDNTGKLHVCYWSALDMLCQRQLRTIAFPCISTGGKGNNIFAAQIALQTVRGFLQLHADKIDRVIFCVPHDKSIEIYRRWMQIYFPVM